MTDPTGVVVTGLGSMSVFGDGVETLWRGLHSGRQSAEPTAFNASAYRTRAVYEVPVEAYADPSVPDDAARMTYAAAAEAVRDAALDPARLRAGGIAFGSTSAGWHLPDHCFGHQSPPVESGPLRKEWPAAMLAERYGLTGPFAVLSSACASSTGALAWATERIRDGSAPLMLVGAVDLVTEIVFAGFHSMRLLAADRTRPFSARRDGFVLAEGAAFLILESAEHASARGARVLAYVLGWGASSDRTHITTPSASGIIRSLRFALADAAAEPDEVSTFFAHGTASDAGDRAEAAAVAEVFDGSSPLVAAIKGATGHTEGAAGMFSLVAAVHGLRVGSIPPVLGADEQDPATSAMRLATAECTTPDDGLTVVHASGFGGVNSTIVLAPESSPRPYRAVAERQPTVLVVARGTGEKEAAVGVPAELADPAQVEPAWPRNPPPDQQCTRVGTVVGAALGALGPAMRHEIREGGLLSGTEFGSQSHHARMYADLTRRGPRGVDPMDFALSTFNVPAAMAALAFEIGGQVETFLGRTGAVEALATAYHAVRTRQAEAILAVGHDAPENRLWTDPGDPELVAGVTVIGVGAADEGVRIAEVHRLEPMRGRDVDWLHAACERIFPAGVPAETWLDIPEVSGGPGVSRWPSARVIRSLAGAAAALDVHAEAIAHILSGAADDVLVISAAPCAATILIRYGR